MLHLQAVRHPDSFSTPLRFAIMFKDCLASLAVLQWDVLDKRMAALVHAGVGKCMKQDPEYWRKRPLSQTALDYASNDVLHLLALADKQKVQLGTATSSLHSHLSLLSSQANWLPADRSSR